MTFFLNRNSFFDDSDPSIKFEWEKLTSSPHKDILNQNPICSDTLTRSQANTQSSCTGYFSLFQRCIVQFKNNTTKQPDGVLDIANAKLQITSSGFSLTKNGTTHEFTSKNEGIIKNWITFLKGLCILVTFHDDYKALKMIGRGSFAKVYLVESIATGKNYAVKAFTKESIILSNKNNAKPSIINEIDLMRCIQHENIIQLYEVYESERSIYLVLELIQGRSLQDTVKKSTFKETYSEIKIINMIRSILDALAYLASKGIMHRDLKPDNILLDKNDKIKVVDFGLATFVKLDTYIFKKCGTPGYIAPEVFKYDEKNPLTFYDDRCDVFSAGCILFYFLFGYPFFDANNASEILQMNRKYTNEFEAIHKVRQELKNPNSKISRDGLLLLLELLEFDQRRRKRAADCLEHPFFTPVPSDMKKLSHDSASEKFADSPKSTNSKGLHIPLMQQSTTPHPKDKYEQKDSLYIDIGQPLFNGKTDTMNGSVSSNNNSLNLGQSPKSGGSNSFSKFAKGGKAGGNDLRKLAILKNNMHGAGDSDPDSPMFKERSSSLGRQTSFKQKEQSEENVEDTPSDHPHVQSPTKNPLKIVAPGKRYQLLENKSAGNSPKPSGQKVLAGGFSKFGEESKSPY